MIIHVLSENATVKLHNIKLILNIYLYIMQNIHNICINYAYMRAKSEGELLHTVKGFLQMIQSNGTGNAEAVCAGAAEHAAGRDHDVCPLQQGLAEFRVAQPRFLDSGEQVPLGRTRLR